MLFGDYFEGDFDRNLFVKFYGGGVFANFFNGLFDLDDLAVDVVTEFFESFGDLDVVYRAEDGAGGRSLGSDSELNVFELFGESFSIGFDLGELVSTLALILGEHLKSRFAGDDSLAGWDEVVAAVTVFHGNDVVFVSEAADVFFEN